MDQNDLRQLASWFDRFCRPFHEDDEDARRNVRLKEDHTRRVRANAARIARETGLDERGALLAEAVALCHDVGRFPQYREYRTFRDSDSTNHAALGARVLRQENALAGLPKPEQDLIVRAVALHNVFTVPGGLDPETLLHVDLVRDADKLDIWRVFIDFLGMPKSERPSAAELGLPDVPEYTPSILADLENRRMVRLSQLRTLNDFRLLQLAWIFDLNFLPSLRMVDEQGTIDALTAPLPRTDEIRRAVEAVRAYVRERLRRTR